jgi:hypothetical protein
MELIDGFERALLERSIRNLAAKGELDSWTRSKGFAFSPALCKFAVAGMRFYHDVEVDSRAFREREVRFMELCQGGVEWQALVFEDTQRVFHACQSGLEEILAKYEIEIRWEEQYLHTWR